MHCSLSPVDAVWGDNGGSAGGVGDAAGVVVHGCSPEGPGSGAGAAAGAPVASCSPCGGGSGRGSAAWAAHCSLGGPGGAARLSEGSFSHC